MNKSIFKEGDWYSFRDYFYMSNPTEEIIAELGYQLDMVRSLLAKFGDFLF
jgi:hypothetical protein